MLFGRAAVGEDVGLYDFELSMSDKRFGCCTEAVDHALETDVFAVITTKCEPFTSSSDKNTKDTPKKQVLAAPSCPGDARLPSQRPGAWQTPRIIGELIAQDKLGHLHGGIIENVPDMIDDDPESPWGSDPARSIARGRARRPSHLHPRRSTTISALEAQFHVLVFPAAVMEDFGVPNRRERALVLFWRTDGGPGTVRYVGESS